MRTIDTDDLREEKLDTWQLDPIKLAIQRLFGGVFREGYYQKLSLEEVQQYVAAAFTEALADSRYVAEAIRLLALVEQGHTATDSMFVLGDYLLQ